MTRKSHFTSQRTALFLGLGVISASLFAGITYAQLNIPTGLSNAMITIQKIMLSTNGTSIDENNSASTIFLDGINGNITTKGPGNFPGGNLGIGGNLIASGEVRLKHTDFTNGTGCNTLTGCILKVTTDGKVQVTNNVNPWLGSEDEQTSVFRRTNGNPNNIFLSTNSGTGAIVGNQADKTYLRIGAVIDPNAQPAREDAAVIAAGNIEARGGVLIRRENSSSESNEGNNLKTVLTRNYTELDMFIEKNNNYNIGFISKRLPSFGTSGQPTTFTFRAVDSNTKVGINTAPGRTPQAELHLADQGKFLVGKLYGSGPSYCDNNIPQTCTADIVDYYSTLFADSTTQRVGINIKQAPQKTLDVNGDASVSNTLTVGHASTFDPGSDKLAVNGSTRANAYYYNSDSRYKSNIENLQSPLKKLLEITGYTYFNKLSNKKDIGVIAQEVESVYPELVQTDADGYKSVQYGNLVAPIIEAIKELASKIDSLFTLYVSQQAKIDTLEARLQVLEAKVK